MQQVHKPVLATEVSALWQAYFTPQKDQRPLDKFEPQYPNLRTNSLLLVDATLGEAGHARQLLEQEPSSRLIGVDADPQMLLRAGQFLRQKFGERPCELVEQNFCDYFTKLPPNQLQANIILFDLGISLFHYKAGRGFSFQPEDPNELLDMRLSPQSKHSAGDLLQNLKEKELADIFWRYGELRNSQRIAHAIVELRRNKSEAQETLGKAAAFARFIRQHNKKNNSKIHPATQVFQALRIAVNDELGQLQQALPAALEQLCPYGLLAVISFHSLEDRLVKQQFRQWQEQGRGQWVYRKALQAPYNTTLNSERSARLRVLRRMPSLSPN